MLRLIMMVWYVVLTSSTNATSVGDVHASTAQFANAQAYQNAVGAAPDQVLPVGWQSASGFPTQLQAAAVAARYNALPADQRSAGGAPLTPSTVPKTVTQSITNPLDFLQSIADLSHRLTEPQTWVRVGEFLVGAMLIYVGIRAAVTPGGVPAASRSVRRTGTGTARTVRRVVEKATPTGRAERVVTRHRTRVRQAQTRQRSTAIRAKQREFGRRELYK